MSGRDGHPERPADARDATAAEIAAVLATPGARFAVAAHHNPDGDALGSMLGVHRALLAAGQDSVLCHPDEHPVPRELAFLVRAGERVHHGPPPDAAERILVSVDCASAMRLWSRPEPPHVGVRRLLNLDHHHDNTRFGHLNLIEPKASSTAEVVVHVLEAAGWPITADVAEPLYVGLLTDTGRFCYSNTGAEAHRVAGLLLEAGVDPHGVASRLYEQQPLDRMLLLGRALGSMRRLAGGRMLMAVLTQEDFHAAGGDDSEGIVEAMRCVEGVVAAGLARRIHDGMFRVSLRSADPVLDVSAIAREEGGGGHVAAAGFSTSRDEEGLMAWLDDRVAAQLDAPGGDG